MATETLANYELFLPYAEWKDRDWKSAIRSAEGFEKRLLQMQEIAVHALAGVQPKPLTAAKLAWAVLWARGFVLLEAASELYRSPAVRAADALHRMAFELWLQVEAIRNPWEALRELQQRSPGAVTEQRLAAAWLDVADRLRGFAAWALTHDLVYYRSRTRDSELRATYHKTDPALLPKTPEEAAIHGYLFGELEVLSEAEAAQDRARARSAHHRIIERLSAWLSDESFGHWSMDLAPWITGEQREIPSLFELLDRNQRSPRSLLRRIGAEHLYGVYARGSMLVHGSSISHFVAAERDDVRGVVVPLVLATDEQGTQLCARLADSCHCAMLGLWGMRDFCLTG